MTIQTEHMLATSQLLEAIFAYPNSPDQLRFDTVKHVAAAIEGIFDTFTGQQPTIESPGDVVQQERERIARLVRNYLTGLGMHTTGCFLQNVIVSGLEEIPLGMLPSSS